MCIRLVVGSVGSVRYRLLFRGGLRDVRFDIVNTNFVGTAVDLNRFGPSALLDSY